jgi:hypothetical protein
MRCRRRIFSHRNPGGATVPQRTQPRHPAGERFIRILYRLKNWQLETRNWQLYYVIHLIGARGKNPVS